MNLFLSKNINYLVNKIEIFFVPPPRLKGSEWADKYYWISPETSGDGILTKWECFPYQTEILDVMGDPDYPVVVFKKSSRVGYTQMFGACIGMNIHNDPRNMLVIQPIIEDIQEYSKDFLSSMCRDIPVIKKLAPAEKSRTSDSTIMRKRFPGMILYLTGANSPRGFRRISAGSIFADEISAWPPEAKKEGDQFFLAQRRADWFLYPKAIAGSTPGEQGTCKITELYEKSDQRKYYVPCPHCEYMQTLQFANLDWSTHGTKKNPVYICEECEKPIPWSKHRWMIEHGEWRAEKEYNGIVGFFIWAAYSYSPGSTWRHIVEAFLNSKDDPIKLKTFVNTWLGEAWIGEGESNDVVEIYDSREDYTAVPIAAGILTAACDTQDDRLEIVIKAWGRDEESWNIEHVVIAGDPGKPEIWQKLDALMSKTYLNESGNNLHISALAIDRGGHHADRVDQFVRTRLARNMFPIQGRAQGEKPIVSKPSKKNKGKVPLFTINTDAAKNIIMSRLKARAGSGRIHLNKNFTYDFCQQLTVEKRVPKYKRGQLYHVWEKQKSARNEALDIEVYNLGILRILFPAVIMLNNYIDSLVLSGPAGPAAKKRTIRSRGIND